MAPICASFATRAGRDPAEERKVLKQFKGIGDVGVDIFFRDVQLGWDELFPFADKKALQGAAKLGVGDDAKTLSRLVKERREIPRLLAGLARVSRQADVEAVLESAG